MLSGTPREAFERHLFKTWSGKITLHLWDDLSFLMNDRSFYGSWIYERDQTQWPCEAHNAPIPFFHCMGPSCLPCSMRGKLVFSESHSDGLWNILYADFEQWKLSLETNWPHVTHIKSQPLLKALKSLSGKEASKPKTAQKPDQFQEVLSSFVQIA